MPGRHPGDVLAEFVRDGRENLWPELADRALKATWPRIVDKVPPQDREDVFQDTLIRLFRALPGFRRERGFFRGFVGILARRSIADYYRARGNEEALPEEDLELLMGTVDPCVDGSLFEDVLRSQLVEILGERDTRVVWLRVVDGYPHKEIAARMAITVVNAKVIVSRAMNKLRDRLGVDHD